MIVFEEIVCLHELHRSAILTDAESTQAKARLLAQRALVWWRMQRTGQAFGHCGVDLAPGVSAAWTLVRHRRGVLHFIVDICSAIKKWRLKT
jgi:hypothetical protein